jgi:hypothetical protein
MDMNYSRPALEIEQAYRREEAYRRRQAAESDWLGNRRGSWLGRRRREH